MPHAHGIAWLAKEIIEQYLQPDGTYGENIHELINQWMSCSLNNDAGSLNSTSVNTSTGSSSKNNSHSNGSGIAKYFKFVIKLCFKFLIS